MVELQHAKAILNCYTGIYTGALTLKLSLVLGPECSGLAELLNDFPSVEWWFECLVVPLHDTTDSLKQAD